MWNSEGFRYSFILLSCTFRLAQNDSCLSQPMANGTTAGKLTFPSRFSCCISCSLLPIPIKAHGWASCSVQPSFSMFSSFFCQPLPNRYTHGGGQKNLNGTREVLKRAMRYSSTSFCIVFPLRCTFKFEACKPFLIAIRFLCNFCVQDEDCLVIFSLQVIPHCLPGIAGHMLCNTTHWQQH